MFYNRKSAHENEIITIIKEDIEDAPYHYIHLGNLILRSYRDITTRPSLNENSAFLRDTQYVN